MKSFQNNKSRSTEKSKFSNWSSNSKISNEKSIVKTPEKVPYDYVTKSEDGKDILEEEIGSKSGEGSLTPYKQLETITEQATYLEMDITGEIRNDWISDKNSEEIKLKSPCPKLTNSKSQSKHNIFI